MIMTLEVKLEIWEITFLWDDKTRLVLFPKVIDMPEHNPGNLGGTMRLGIRRTVFKTENSILSKFLRLLVLRHRVSFALPLPPLPLSFQTSSPPSPPNLLLPNSFPRRGWWNTRGCPFPFDLQGTLSSGLFVIYPCSRTWSFTGRALLPTRFFGISPLCWNPLPV